MKRKPKAKTVIYPETGDTLAQIKEDAAAYGLRRDVLGVREAKDQMSSLLKKINDKSSLIKLKKDDFESYSAQKTSL